MLSGWASSFIGDPVDGLGAPRSFFDYAVCRATEGTNPRLSLVAECRGSSDWRG